MTKVWGATSTADEVLSGIDLTGNVFSSPACPRASALRRRAFFATHGAQVTGAVRDLEKAAARLRRCKRRRGEWWRFELIALDLASLKSVRTCADELLRRGSLSTWSSPMRESWRSIWAHGDGFETQLGTTTSAICIGHRLAPLIRAGGRLITSRRPASLLQCGPGDPNFPTDGLRSVRRLRPVQDSQHSLRGCL